MNRAMILVLLAFGSAALTPGQSLNKPSPEKDGKQTSVQATATPASLNFGNQVVETTSKPLSITLTNNTNNPIKITGVDTSEDDVDFVVDDDYEFLDTTIEAGKSCNVSIVFFPLYLGQRTAFLLITYDDVNNPQKILLRGNGIEPGR